MSKFNPGDQFYVKDRGHEGQVIAVSCQVDHWGKVDMEYTVLWYDKVGSHSYTANQVDHLWEKVPAAAMRMMQAVDFMPLDTKVGCDHKWVDAGFRFTIMVCYHCGVEMP